MIPLIRRFFRPDFVESFADHVRDRQQQELEVIQIPTNRFKDQVFVHNAFISHGRIPVTIDVTSFDRKVTVITQDGEFWSGEIATLCSKSVLRRQLTSTDIHELNQIRV